MVLPSYNIHAILQKEADFESLIQCSDISDLSSKLLGVKIKDAINEDVILQYLKNSSFQDGAEFLSTEEFLNGLKTIIINLLETARSWGFPNSPSQKKQESKIDISLSKVLIESFEQNKFDVRPCHGNSRLVQEFMTKRVLALIVFWRWRIVTGKAISIERILSSPRNYFYTLWLSGWLFDKGPQEGIGRWDLLDQMSSDSLVQIIERSGIGFRKGFAQAIAMERKNRSPFTQNSVLDNLVRGCMKRATFTFSTSIMIDNDDYYKKICGYLFNWAEKNYLPFVS